MIPKMIFMDIDGTLVDANIKISALDKDSICQLIDQGTLVYLATGRKYQAAKAVAKNLHSQVKVIASNGCVYDCEQKLIKNALDLEALIEAFEICQRKNVSLFFFGLSETFYSKDLPDYFKNEDKGRLVSEGEREFIKISNLYDLQKFSNLIINGIIISEDNFEILEEIKTELEASENLSVSSSAINNLELTPKSVTKATAISALQDYYGVNKEETVAFGDGMNDLEMFGQVHYSVAMGNASELVKKEATYETLSNLDSGISHFLKYLSSQ